MPDFRNIIPITIITGEGNYRGRDFLRWLDARIKWKDSGSAFFMKNARQFIAVTLMATAICADRSPPGRARGVGDFPSAGHLAGRLIERLSVNFRRVVPAGQLYQTPSLWTFGPTEFPRRVRACPSIGSRLGFRRFNSACRLRFAESPVRLISSRFSSPHSFEPEAFHGSQFSKVMTKVFGSRNERLLKRYQKAGGPGQPA